MFRDSLTHSFTNVVVRAFQEPAYLYLLSIDQTGVFVFLVLHTEHVTHSSGSSRSSRFNMDKQCDADSRINGEGDHCLPLLYYKKY